MNVTELNQYEISAISGGVVYNVARYLAPIGMAAGLLVWVVNDILLPKYTTAASNEAKDKSEANSLLTLATAILYASVGGIIATSVCHGSADMTEYPVY